MSKQLPDFPISEWLFNEEFRAYLKPKVVGEPAEATENEEFPVIPTHSDILDGLVDHLRLACIVLKLLGVGFMVQLTIIHGIMTAGISIIVNFPLDALDGVGIIIGCTDCA